MIKNVLFDLDGTLLDTREGIIESAKYTAAALGYEELPYETMLKFIGPPIQNSFIRFYGCDAAEAQYASEFFREYYKTKTLFMAEPYEGIYDLCRILKENGIRMAVATYKREDYALSLLRYFHFHEYCDPMHGADNNNVLKKEDIIRMCLEEMDAKPEDSVLIGDTENDAKGALMAGIPFIAVTYGFGFKTKEEINAYPNIGVAAIPMEVAEIIMKFNKK